MIDSMKNAFSLEGKNAIVTGGNRGIGLGIAEAFAQQGANVAILCRDAVKATEVIRDFQGKYPGKFIFCKADVGDRKSCKAAVSAVADDFGSIDILVNNSGIAVGGGLLDMDDELEQWERCLNIDLTGAMRMSYYVSKLMRAAGRGGRIINITSNAGAIVNKPNIMVTYSVAKAGLNQLTRNLAVELGADGIRVNAIAPGYTYSTLTNQIPEEARAPLMEKMPSGRFGQAIEVGALAVYLASDASDMMTGNVLTLDGGYSLAV
jgi:NAD(P)-dependent dehydrogenase (short-subunit alcohol dehydrogenase family)